MKFLIVGGGPVGLFLAIKLIERFGKKVDIKLYEKRSKYSRKQIIVFQPYLLKKVLPVELANMFEGKVCHGVRPSYDDYGFCFGKSLSEGQNLVSIIISELEDILMKYLVKIRAGAGGMEIVKKEFGDSSKKDLAWANVVVGADSKKSYVREKLLKAEFIEHIGFKSFGLALTFEDKSNPKYFIKFDNKLDGAVRRIELKEPSVEQHRKRLFRSVGKMTYLGLQIDPDEFEGVEGKMDEYGNAEYVFKMLPNNLKKVIKEYLAYHGSEPVGLDKVRVYVFKIKLSHSESYSRVLYD